MLKDINFGDVDAKNEILKQSRVNSREFYDSYYMHSKIDIEEIISGSKYFIIGLKGTGKTALIRYLNDITSENSGSEIILFKSHISEDDRQSLSNSSGYNIVTTDGKDTFSQDFKEAWKWLIIQRISELLSKNGENSEKAKKLYKLTGVSENRIFDSIGKLFSTIKSGKIKISADAKVVATEIGLEFDAKKDEVSISVSDLNRTCSKLLNEISPVRKLYIYFDELEVFHETIEQFNRDRRILRDLIYAISQINSESAENKRPIFLVSTLRSEVLHSVLELGHEISRDIDDYGIKLDWSDSKADINHPLMQLIGKKISISLKIDEKNALEKIFPEKINNKPFYSFILDSSYFRPRDVVRLLRVARDYKSTENSFSTEHFDKTASEYSSQTWVEVTEELLASYSSEEISSIQKLFLGFSTHFTKEELLARINEKYSLDEGVRKLKEKIGVDKLLSDLYRIGVIGNDFWTSNSHGRKVKRDRWIFRGKPTLNDAERMAFHKSLWKHLSLA